MITNHGVHECEVTPGLPDTGGQNVHLNQFTDALTEQGYRVTIVGRGGKRRDPPGDLPIRRPTTILATGARPKRATAS